MGNLSASHKRARAQSKNSILHISKLLQSAIARRPPESRWDYAGRGPDYSDHGTWYPLCKFRMRECVREIRMAETDIVQPD